MSVWSSREFSKASEIVKMGIVKSFQIPSPFPNLTVLENMAVSHDNTAGEDIFSCLFRKKWIRQERERNRRASQFLKLLGLHDSRNVLAYTLSGGQLKLLELGRVFMTNAKIFLLDEPIGGVNPILARKIFDYIAEYKKEKGGTFVIVEHRLDIAMPYADYIYAMSRGRIVAEGGNHGEQGRLGELFEYLRLPAPPNFFNT
jgi:branched-chain amino acid transport system ATP-binding protein